MFLMKTNWSIVEMRRLCFDLNFQSVMAVLCDGRSGGLSMFWKADCNLHIQTFSPKHIDAHILPINQRLWCLIGFHGRPEGLRKQESWYFLKNLHARSSLPWVYMGDYNEALHSTEKQGGLPKQLVPMLAFKETLLHFGQHDLGYQGYPFTWSNGRAGEVFVEERLDRVCANADWQALFPTGKVRH